MEPRHVICLIVDRLRASALGGYGGSWCETPQLDRLASESLVLDQALADSLTLESLYHGFWQSQSPFRPRSTDVQSTLPGLVSRQGWSTYLLSDEPAVAEHSLAEDFDARECVTTEPTTTSADDWAETQLAHLFAATIDRLDQLRTKSDSPFFLWLHSRAMAGPWDAPYAFRQQLADEEDPDPPREVAVPNRSFSADDDPDLRLGYLQSYHSQVLVLDRCVGTLLDYLRETGLDRQCLVVLLGARGMALGEHGEVGPTGDRLLAPVVQTPWLLRFPDALGAMCRSDRLMIPSDLPCMLLDWLAVRDKFPVADGQSLWPFDHDEPSPARDHVCLHGADDERAIRTLAWQFRTCASSDLQQLFVKPDDRWEMNEISSRCPEIVAGLQAYLTAYEQAVAAGRSDDLPPLAESLLTAPD